MYNKFFGLAEAPFNITPDSKFLFLSQRHREALAALLYGIKERKGFILLTGEIGSGKTTICRALVQELRQENIKLALVLNPGLSEIELLKTINDEFQIPSFYDTKKGLVDALNSFLITESQRGNNVVLIIDEAQNLDPALLEQVRMLSNLETEETKLIQIVLMGQPELNDTLRLSQLEQLNQRITVRYHITSLSESEMLAYIKHRLFVARAKVDVEFTEGAIRLAYQATRGIPRKINVLCDRALLACYVEGSYTVDEQVMQKAVQEVGGSRPVVPRKTESSSPRQMLNAVSSALFTRRVAFVGIGILCIVGLVYAAIKVGVRIANVRDAELASARQPAQVTGEKAEHEATGEIAFPKRGDVKTSETLVKAAPTPPPNWDELRRKKPNWMYEKNVPLVRVNNPKAVYRAAQFSLLKMWGYAVNLAEMAKLGDDFLVHGEFKSDLIKIRQVPIQGEYYQAVWLNVPMIVKMKNPVEDVSEYVVLLQAQGEAVTVGDPVWGVKTYKAKEFIKRWNGATALLVDKHQLSAIKRGDRSDRIRSLQQFLRDFLEGQDAATQVDVSGVFDVKTAEAIKRFQAYYKLPETGSLDDVTVLLLNSRMMPDGPRLNAAGGVG